MIHHRVICNAKIESVFLGYEDHQILTAYLHLSFSGCKQGFGGYALDAWDVAKGKRVPDQSLGTFICGVMIAAGVEKWDDLKGKFVRVDCDNSISCAAKIHGIGHIIDDLWFYPEKEFALNQSMEAKEPIPFRQGEVVK
jgi:hypothetical protein